MILNIHKKLLNNSIDAKEFINKEYNIKFEYPDEWKLVQQEKPSFEIEYDKRPIVTFIPDPNIGEDNYFSLFIYTNMYGLDDFQKTIRNEFVKDEDKIDIIDVKNIKIINHSEVFILINTIHSSMQSGLLSHLLSSSVEKNYLLFHKDKLGYKIEYLFPVELQRKYLNIVTLIASQIIENIGIIP